MEAARRGVYATWKTTGCVAEPDGGTSTRDKLIQGTMTCPPVRRSRASAYELIYATIVLSGNSVVSFMALGSGFFQISFWTAHGSAIGSRLRIVSKIPSRMSINLHASQFLPLLESSHKCGVVMRDLAKSISCGITLIAAIICVGYGDFWCSWG